MLHGVGEDAFKTTFGLSHVTLREGGEALLHGGGDLGESLFQAGLGGTAVHTLLAELHEEAGAIWSAQARNKPLNEALRAVSEAQRAVKDRSATPESVILQEKHVKEQEEARARLHEERTSLTREQKRLERVRRAMPHLARRAELRAKLAALGEVPLLPEDAAHERVLATRAEVDAAAQIAQRTREVEALAARLEQIGEASPFADAGAEMEALGRRLGVYANDLQEQPRARAELAALEAEARAIGSERSLALDAPRVATVKKLAGAPARLEEQLRAKASARADAEALVAAHAARGDARSPRLAHLEKTARAKLAAIGLADLDAARALPVPPLASVERAARDDAARAQAEERLASRRADLARREREIATGLDALARAAVPTEADLTRAREARDRALAELRVTPKPIMIPPLEAAIRSADEIADRLRREAERVASHAKLLADQAACAKEAEECAREAEALALRAAAAEAKWREVWAPSGVPARSPEEMRAWLSAHASAVEAIDGLRAAEADEARARTEERERLLAAAGKCAREHDAAEAALAAWRREWSLATAGLGLGEAPGVEEALAAIETTTALGRVVAAIEKEQRRVQALDKETREIEAEIARLVALHAPDLAGAPPAEAGAKLIDRHARARAKRDERVRLEEQLAEKRAAREEEEERAARAAARIRELMAAAKVDSVEALAGAEEKSALARKLALDLEQREAQLMEQAEGAPLEALEAEAAATSPEAVVARLDDIDARVAELADEIKAIDQDIGRTQAGLSKFDGEAAAYEAAVEAQEQLARVRAQAERYARVRLAELVLSRVIERYRDENQGPLLSRASAIFARLTGGAYAGLRAVYDDDEERAVLKCVKGEREIAVEVLSDGARDQLYLALRVASLERQAKAGTALPLVLDDALVHFDDDRARAALGVLAELAQSMQVLFFTHHARLVAIAREACPATIHELDRAPAVALAPPAQ
jgi:uncharacterized protein YhaN